METATHRTSLPGFRLPADRPSRPAAVNQAPHNWDTTINGFFGSRRCSARPDSLLPRVSRRRRAARGLVAKVAVLGSIAAAPVTAASATTEPPAAPAAEGKVTDFLGYVGGPAEPPRANRSGSATSTRTAGRSSSARRTTTGSTSPSSSSTSRPEASAVARSRSSSASSPTPKKGQQCGQRFANDDSIAAVISGPTVTGTQAFYAALAESKAVVHGVSSRPGRHHPAQRRRAQRRCRLHPRAVRDVRPGGARRRIGGADVFGGDPVRRGRRAGVGVRDSASRSSRALLAEHPTPSRCSPPGPRTPTS